MSRKRDRLTWGLVAGVVALGAGGALAQRRLKRSIAADPEERILRTPPSGRPVAVRSKDGTQLHVEIFGDEDRPTVVLAHGWTEMLAYWTYVIRELSERGLRVAAYDLRGHGQSGPAAGADYSLARFGEDLAAVLEACVPDGQRAVIAGHSLGAMSIAAWAEHHDVPQRACAAALLNTGLGDLVTEHLLMPVPALANLINRVVAPDYVLSSRAPIPRFSTPISHGLIRYATFGPTASPAQIAFFERMLIACPPDVRADVGIAMSEMDLHHALERLTVPTVVIAGARDRLTPPSHAQRIAEMLPQLTELIVLPETGHMGPLERGHEVSEAIAALASSPVPHLSGAAQRD